MLDVVERRGRVGTNRSAAAVETVAATVAGVVVVASLCGMMTSPRSPATAMS